MGRGKDAFTQVFGTRRGGSTPYFDSRRDAREGTDHEKLKRAFAVLRRRGLAARVARTEWEREDYLPPKEKNGWLLSDAMDKVVTAPKSYPGCFGLSLAIYFGSYDEEDGPTREEVARRAVEELCLGGLDASWDGDTDHAIMVCPEGMRVRTPKKNKPHQSIFLPRVL